MAAALRAFLKSMTLLVAEGHAPARAQAEAMPLLQALVARPGWLPPAFRASEANFRQLLLYLDPLERFTLVAFVWGREAHETPIHDHGMWGAVGVLEGEEISTEMIPGAPGESMRPGRRDHLGAGEVMGLAPGGYDIHKVENGRPGAPGVTIHVYGGNIGAIPRHMYDPLTSVSRRVRTGYDNPFLPNPW